MELKNAGAFLPDVELDREGVPPGVDRRTFMMRSAVIVPSFFAPSSTFMW